jgi:hypothetical protein
MHVCVYMCVHPSSLSYTCSQKRRMDQGYWHRRRGSVRYRREYPGVCVCVCVCVCVYIYICVCIYIYVCVCVTQDSGYVVVGWAQHPSLAVNEFDAFIIKLDASGVEVWSRTFDGGVLAASGQGAYDQFQAVVSEYCECHIHIYTCMYVHTHGLYALHHTRPHTGREQAGQQWICGRR